MTVINDLQQFFFGWSAASKTPEETMNPDVYYAIFESNRRAAIEWAEKQAEFLISKESELRP